MQTTRGRVVRTIGAEGAIVDGIEYRNCNVVDFGGRHYVFSHRAILTLVVLAACNAACRFCSNEITFTPSGPYLHWNDQLARVKEFAQVAGVTKIAYTGGEPTLNPQKLHDLLCAMNPGFNRARLHTNGWGLFKTVQSGAGDRELLDAMIAVGLTGASISVAHFDPQINRQIMALPKSWAGMPDEGLAEIAARRSERFTPRLSCVLTAEGVHDCEGIFDYLEWGRSLGFRKFIFRTCSEIPDGFKKATDYSAYNDANATSIEPLTRQILRRSEITLTYRQRKSDSKVDVFQWRDITFDVDESSEEIDPDPKIRRLNVMPDGVTYTSWISPLSVLFADDLETARRSARRELPVAV